MRIVIETIPHKKQRYSTVGDWVTDKDGTVHIFVSDMGNEDYAFLVGLHELIEQKLCAKRGISQQSVDRFDKQFERDRAKGKHGEDDEAGDDPKAPYRKEHFFGTNVEALMCGELGLDWRKYEKAVYSLP